jgi:hypothetical protein
MMPEMRNGSPFLDIPPPSDLPEEIADEAAGGRGWEGLADWTGGLPPDQVEELAAVRELEAVYPLLHALLGRSPREFFVRAAVMEALVKSARPAFSSEDLDEILYWLAEPARGTALRALRQSGWLEFDPAAGHALTDAGRWVGDVLSFLHHRLRESELLPTVEGVRYALEIGLDPLRHLQSMRSRLSGLRHEIDEALASHSEVVLRRTAAKLQEVLRLSERIRAVLDAVRLDQVAARRVAREIHDLLSRLHGASSTLHAAVTEVGRQYLRLTAGLTTEQIVRALMAKSLSELAAVGREALLPVLPAPPLLTTDAVAYAALLQALRERAEIEPVSWSEPADAPRAADAVEVPPEVERLLLDLAAAARGGEPVALSRIVPAGDPGESFLRGSLLALVGQRFAGEGIAGRLGSLPLAVLPAGDGWPEELPEGPLTRLTPGKLQPREPA